MSCRVVAVAGVYSGVGGGTRVCVTCTWGCVNVWRVAEGAPGGFLVLVTGLPGGMRHWDESCHS